MNRRILTLVIAVAGVVGTAIAQPPRAGTVSAEAAGTVAAGTAATAQAKVPATTVARNAAAAARGMSSSANPVEITINREVFDYDRSGRRDPYKSLMSSSDVRPLLSDLRLTAVAFDPAGNNSVAILRDSYSKQQYRIRVGQQLGRLRVSGIRQRTVQFTIEEFGFNRQETLAMAGDTTKVRNP
ncbi:MAG TPA: hypothetical protein VE869_16865 [Gemmatimonas sp.]|nr:hypothetical protein [Gemmatimonas sp.]